MVGTFSQSALDGLKNVDGTDGPARVDQTSNGAAPGVEGDFNVEYTMQTGLTRYAPMQPVPPTKITKNKATPLHPTSGFTIAKTFMALPKIQTTITQSQTFSISSRENPVSAPRRFHFKRLCLLKRDLKSCLLLLQVCDGQCIQANPYHRLLLPQCLRTTCRSSSTGGRTEFYAI